MDVEIGTIPVTLTQLPGGRWRGEVKVGPVVVSAECDGELLRRLVAFELRRRPGASVAGHGPAVERLTARVVGRKLARQVAPVARSLARDWTTVGALAARGCGEVAARDVRAAASLLGRARSGDVAAKLAVARVVAAAQSGDPGAVRAASVLCCAERLSTQVGGPVWDWVKDQMKYRRGVRPEEEQYSMRDAYRTGAQGYAAMAAASRAARRR